MPMQSNQLTNTGSSALSSSVPAVAMPTVSTGTVAVLPSFVPDVAMPTVPSGTDLQSL